MSQETTVLRQEIRTAFARRTYPGDDHLALGGPRCPGDESEDIARFFRGKDWREITLDSILAGGGLDLNSFLFFMSAEGFVYYLPALLIASLDIDDRFDLGEPLAFNLTPPPAGPERDAWRDQFTQIVSSLTPEEKRAVAHVLEHLAREYEKRSYVTNQAQVALDGYWSHLTSDLSS